MTHASEATVTRATVLPLLLIGVGAPIPLAAQAADNLLTPGTRIRVEAPTISEGRRAGSLESIDATAIHLTLEDGGSLTVPRGAVESIDVSAGRRSHWVRGAGIGALVGLVFSGTVAIIGASQGDDELTSLDNAMYGAFIVVTTAGSAVVGAITGAFIRTEQWKPVSPSGVQWGLGPTRDGGIGFAVALQF
jgi:hypothetical protein